MGYELITKRLSLKKLNMADASLVKSLLQNQALMKWFGGSLTDVQVTEWLLENRRRYQTDGYSYLLVQDKLTHEVVGLMGLLQEAIQGQSHLGLAYLVAPHQQGCGYVKEGGAALLAYAFHELEASTVVAQMAEKNHPSRAVASSLGFSYGFEYRRQHGANSTLYQVYQLDRQHWEERR